MNLKTLAGKTVFFALIVLFVMGFSELFGQENSLTGVVVVVLALMMLGQDLSVRPMMNLAGLVAFTLLMGLGAYASVACGNAFVGAVLNLSVVFLLCYMTTQDLRSPMHFPFLLGYAFMLSVPVSAEDLPVRVLALVVGSVFIVLLNVLINRNRHSKTCHGGIIAICREVSGCCRGMLDDGQASSDNLDAVCMRLRGSMYDRLRRSFFATPGDGTVLSLVSALHMAGRSVCRGGHAKEVLEDLASLMDTVSAHEGGSREVSDVVDAANGFLDRHPDANDVLRASVVDLRDGLSSLASDNHSVRRDVHLQMRAMARETVRRDSARFTFAVRMSVVFTLFAFVWQYWDLENAKWLLFTTVALVLPYVDGAWRKSAMRLTGTLAGIAAFAVVLVATGGELGLLTAALMLANYVYTVLDHKRYDVMMVFITFSALVAASMSAPADDAVLERIAFILLGVVVATAANYLLLPYRLDDENASLGGRYLALNDSMLEHARSALEGRRDADGETVAGLTAAGVSAKLHMNAETCQDGDADLFLSLQDGVSSQCAMLCRGAGRLTEEGRSAALSALSGDGTEDACLTDRDAEYLAVLRATLRMQDESRSLQASLGP